MLVQSFSGIRGIYGKDLTEDTARRYAFVFNEFLKNKLNREPLIVVGYDTRKSNRNLKSAIFDALFNIIDVGILPIAAIEVAVRAYKSDGGVVITASHNPKEYNGFKFLDSDGAVLRPKDINEIINNFEKISKLSKEDFLKNHLFKEQSTQIRKIDKKNGEMITLYSRFLKSIVGTFHNQTKILVDVNGGSAIILKEIIKKLDMNHTKIINDKPGQFKREIEPNKESLKYLKNILEKENADFAAGFDCDADRIEILLKDGKIVDGNHLLAIIADDILSKHKGTMVVNDATSNLLKRIAEKHNCSIKEVEVGEINVVNEMLKLKSPIGGEGSNGGVIIPPSRCRDGILSLLFILKIINSKKKSLKQLIEELPQYYTLQKKVAFKNKSEPKTVKNKIKDYYSKKKYIIQETGGITGGLKVIIDKHTFVWFRFSKTEPNTLRIIADSNSELTSKKLLAEASFRP